MKIYLQNHVDWFKIMKLTFSQIIIALICTCMSYATTSKGQALLEQRLDINIHSSSLNLALKQLEKVANLKFVYRKSLVAGGSEISVDAKQETLGGILTALLEPRRIAFEVVGNRIILSKINKAEPVATQPTAEMKISPPEVVNKTVSGTVTDETDKPLPGVSIKIKGTSAGAVSDVNGKFSITIPDGSTTLVFSYIGYLPQEISILNQTVINIQLKAAPSSLNEVVVVGYGQQRKETLTGSISTVSGKDITKSPSPNVISSLAGRLPGLIVNQRSGEPGRDDPNILIRGTGTLNDNSPLIIIDGVQRSLLARLNPDDIESISVLKDASAAIYGARAANGVILVTTKRGAKGKPVFDFSYNYSFQKPAKIPDVLDAATFAQVYNEGDFYRKGRPASYTPFYSDESIQKYSNGSDPVLYPNTNWVKEVSKPSTYQKRYNIQVNGGTDNVRYLLSFGSVSQDGAFKNNPTSYKQYNFRAKIDVDINKYLNIGANLSAILNNRIYPSAPTATNFINILQANPTIVARYPNGLIGPGRLGENPLLLDQRGYDKINDAPVYSTFTATLKIPYIDGLKLDASYNYDFSNQFEKLFNIPYSYYEYNVNTKNYDKKQGTATGTTELTDTYRKFTTILYNFRLSYEHAFARHHVTAMVGNEQQQNFNQNAFAYRKNFVSTAIDEINTGSTAPADKNNGGSSSSSAYNNFFGRINYDFASKYLVEFVFRYDGSPTFPAGKRYGFFPGISAGWRLSEEKFIKDNFSFVNQLKLRATYGQIGNDRVGQYAYLQSFSFGNNFVFGSNDVPGIYANTVPNPYITWERSKKTDLGLEALMWNGLLGIDFTLWKENRSNILASRNASVSHIYGFPALPPENIAKVNNGGFELSLSHRNKIGEFIYNLRANLAYQRSKIVFFDEVPPSEPYQTITGRPVGAGLYYKADGIFHTQQELNSYPHAGGTQVGDVKLLDLNNDGILNAKDRFAFDYNNIPKYTYGFNMDFQYENFDLNILFQGQAKAYKYDNTFAALGGSDFANASVARAENRWTVSNPNGTMPRADGYQPGASTFFLYDASFIRLKTVELGYTLPKELTSRLRISNMRFFVSGFNLLTWSKEIKWADPELSGDYTTYPPLRVINLGVNVKF